MGNSGREKVCVSGAMFGNETRCCAREVALVFREKGSIRAGFV